MFSFFLFFIAFIFDDGTTSVLKDNRWCEHFSPSTCMSLRLLTWCRRRYLIRLYWAQWSVSSWPPPAIRGQAVWTLCQAWLAGALTVNITCLGDRANKSLIRIRPNKKNLMFRARVLKTLGRVGSVVFFKDWKLNYKDPNEKKIRNFS